MSVTGRILSGSAAAWMRIVINMGTQLALVPVYLSYWDVTTYGVWVAVLALVNILSFLDLGHQNYLGNEFLKLGERNRMRVSVFMCSGIFIAIFTGLFMVAFVGLLIGFGRLHLFLGDALEHNPALVKEAGHVALIQALVWMLSGSIGGIINRALYPFGYLPRLSWWGIYALIVTSLLPVLAVAFGAGLLGAGIAMGMATLAFNVPLYIDMLALLRRENIRFVRPSLNIGFHNFIRSLFLSGRGLLESARQQGIRVIMTPLAGPAALVAFTTMRTGANVALQGLGTITNPIMPELMRFLNLRDQERTEASFSTVWMVLVVILAPSVLILQAFIEPLFLLWTRGQVTFDPLLFGLLSLGVLVYALAQPAIAVVSGNNILKPQLFIAAGSAVLVIGLMFLLMPALGIAGVGMALLASELFSALVYRVVAQRWLREKGMYWPRRQANIAGASVFITALSGAAMIGFPDLKWLALALGLVLLMVTLYYYMRSLPAVARTKVRGIAQRVPVVNRL